MFDAFCVSNENPHNYYVSTSNGEQQWPRPFSQNENKHSNGTILFVMHHINGKKNNLSGLTSTQCFRSPDGIQFMYTNVLNVQLLYRIENQVIRNKYV